MAVCKFADCRRFLKKIDKKKAAICKICRLPQICDPRNFPMIVINMHIQNTDENLLHISTFNKTVDDINMLVNTVTNK